MGTEIIKCKICGSAGANHKFDLCKWCNEALHWWVEHNPDLVNGRGEFERFELWKQKTKLKAGYFWHIDPRQKLGPIQMKLKVLTVEYANSQTDYILRTIDGFKIFGDAADDVLSKVIEVVWNKNKDEPYMVRDKNFTLRSITKNCCLNEIKRRKKDPEVLSWDPMNNVESDKKLIDIKPSLDVEQELSIDMLDALNMLSERQKQAFIFFSIDNLSHQQIAEEMGISIQASRSLVSKARQTLHKALA